MLDVTVGLVQGLYTKATCWHLVKGVTCTANGTLIDQHCCVMVYITLLQIPGEKKTRSASILSQFYLIGYEPQLELRIQKNHIFDVLLKFFRSTSNMH